MVRGFKNCCIADEMKRRMKKSGMLTVSMRQDGNCEDTKLKQVIRMVNKTGEAE
jgi:hypothetical protein